MGTDAAELLASQIEITGPIRAPQSTDRVSGGHAPWTQVYFGWPLCGGQRAVLFSSQELRGKCRAAPSIEYLLRVR